MIWYGLAWFGMDWYGISFVWCRVRSWHVTSTSSIHVCFMQSFAVLCYVMPCHVVWCYAYASCITHVYYDYEYLFVSIHLNLNCMLYCTYVCGWAGFSKLREGEAKSVATQLFAHSSFKSCIKSNKTVPSRKAWTTTKIKKCEVHTDGTFRLFVFLLFAFVLSADSSTRENHRVSHVRESAMYKGSKFKTPFICFANYHLRISWVSSQPFSSRSCRNVYLFYTYISRLSLSSGHLFSILLCKLNVRAPDTLVVLWGHYWQHLEGTCA